MTPEVVSELKDIKAVLYCILVPVCFATGILIMMVMDR